MNPVTAKQQFVMHRKNKNHYNVKLLRAMALQSPLTITKMHEGWKDPFTGHQNVEEWFVTPIPYERIVIAGKCYVSTKAIQLLTDHNINVMQLDSFAKLVANMNNVIASPTGTSYRIGQSLFYAFI